MNEAKVAGAQVDAERVVRELRDAFKSLKMTPALSTRSSPSEEERRQQPTQSPEDSRFKRVGDTRLKVLADARCMPRAPLEALTEPVSDSDEGGPEQILAFESAENSKTPGNQTEAQPGQYEVVEGFCSHHETVERLLVTPRELKALSGASLLGSLTCKKDVLVMLHQISGARKPAKLQTVQPETLRVLNESIEPSMPDVSEMTDRIRREALARLTESDSLRDVDRRSPYRQFFVFSALVLMAAMTGIFMNLVHPLWPKTGRVLLSGEILFAASLIVGSYLRWGRSLTQSRR